jgi:hypothetical protein
MDGSFPTENVSKGAKGLVRLEALEDCSPILPERYGKISRGSE